MGNFRKNRKKASMARKSVDIAQNKLLKSMKSDIDDLKTDIESKYGYQVLSDSVDAYTGTPSISGQIYKVDIGATQGLTDQERVGDQVTLKHIDFNYRICQNFARPSEYRESQTTCRVMMFWDNQPSAVSSTGINQVNPVQWPNLLQLAINSAATTTDQRQLLMLSEKDWDSRKRFSIIYDKTHTLIPGGQNANPAVQFLTLGSRAGTGVVRFNKNYKGQKIRYANGGVIPQNRQLYYAFLSDQGTPTNNETAVRPTIQINTRVIYDDA